MIPHDQLKNLERRLGLREAQLGQEITAARQRTEGQAPGEVTDAKDAAAVSAQAVVADAEVARDLAELRDIHLARERITDASYGACLDCGEDIDVRRLLAQPATSRCQPCQGRAEHAAATGNARPGRRG
jgi:DnaK suppressor protein